MLQPSSHVANTIVATSVTVGGVATGLDFSTLLAGFAGGLVSLSFLPPMSMWRRIWTPVTATLTAGYTAPVATHYLTGLLGAAIEPLTLQVAGAFGIGVTAQVALPLLVGVVHNRLVRLQNPGE